MLGAYSGVPHDRPILSCDLHAADAFQIQFFGFYFFIFLRLTSVVELKCAQKSASAAAAAQWRCWECV